MVAVRAVVFDIGGVLEITPSTGWVQKWEAHLGLPAAGLAGRTRDIWRPGDVGAITLDEVHHGLAAALGLDPAAVHALMEDVWTEYLGTPNTDLIGYFRDLRPRYRTALLSNSFVGAREREQERYGFAQLADLIVYSHEVGLAKPDPRVYELTCERLGVRPAEAVFVDDVEGHVEAARAVGMHGVVFRDNAQVVADVEAHLGRCGGGGRL